ncbi:MAG TPA: hemerythrin domain-containing protein [Pyrinomonadaceae bacterium]|nr:hemerythrin domain-containing protein [Pyrinomonadaceae bacterium]
MDAFSLLKEDHRKVAELFKQLESATGKKKLTVFEQIKTELELHTHIEEKIFYPALEEPEQTHDLTLEAYEEHDVVKRLLRELGRAKTADDEWEAKAKVLQENVEHHVEEEENELFKKARAVLGQEEIEALGEELETEKMRKQGGGASKSASKSSNKSAKKASGSGHAAKRVSGKAASKRSSKSSSKTSTKKSAKKR